MASIRCEQLAYDETMTSDGGSPDGTGSAAIVSIGAANTTTALTGSSAVVFGPVALAPIVRQITVLVEVDGATALVTKGASPTVTAANGKRIKDGTYAQFTLFPGESLAAMTTTIT